MKYLRLMLIIFTITTVSSCAAIDCRPDKLKTGRALPGTETVVVGISIDKNGVPQESYKDIVLYPGQKVVFAGPDEFSIIFKDKKTPNRQIENRSSNGAVQIKIPEKILEQREFVEEFRKNKSLTFDYTISVNGKELDPPMIIIQRN